MVDYYGKSGGRNFPEYFFVGVDTKSFFHMKPFPHLANNGWSKSTSTDSELGTSAITQKFRVSQLWLLERPQHTALI